MSSMNRQYIRILIEVLCGIGLSVLSSFIAIGIGFSRFYKLGAAYFKVRLLGLPIFNIVREGSKGVGTPLTQNMVLMGIIFSVIIVIIAETAVNVRRKKQTAARD